MNVAVVNFPGSSSNDLAKIITEQYSENVDVVQHTVTDLQKYDLIILPGGFSYGDYLRPGALASQTPVIKEIISAANKGKKVLGIGNGFQILTELQLLPGAFLQNEQLKFVCKQVNINVLNNKTYFTSEYEQDEVVVLPIAHEQGNYYCDDVTLQQLKNNDQIVFTYENNPNGSLENIAGLINEKGNVLGLMAHPERAVDELLGSVAGLKLFQSIFNK